MTIPHFLGMPTRSDGMEPCSTPGKSHETHMVSCAGPTSGAFLSGGEYCHGNIYYIFLKQLIPKQPVRLGPTKPDTAIAFKNSRKGVPWWVGGKESACQCRRCGFDP